MSGRAVAFAVVAVAALAVVRPAIGAAPAAEREARQAFQRAEAHFRAGLFAEALGEYQAGYAAAPLPGFLINIAQCERRLGDLVRARASYQKFVLVAPDSPLVPEVKSLIAELDKLIDDLGEDGTKQAGGVESETASHESQAAAVAVPGAIAPVSGTPVASVGLMAAPPPETHASTHRRWWLWALVGAAVAGGAVAVFASSSSSSSATTIHDGTLGTLRR